MEVNKLKIVYGSPMKRNFFEEFNSRYQKEPHIHEIVEVVLRSIIKTDDKSGINTTADIGCGNCIDDCNYQRIEAAIRGLEYLKKSPKFLRTINNGLPTRCENSEDDLR